jgi:hypothetical protein
MTIGSGFPRVLPGSGFEGKLCVTLLLMTVLAGPSAAASDGTSLAIEHDSTAPGGVVFVPVSIFAATDVAGINLRVEYDPAILSSPTVVRGMLLADSHLLWSNSPAPGRFDVMACSTDTFPLADRAGTVLYLGFAVDEFAAEGLYPISFAADGTLGLPASGVSDMAGIRISHTAEPGSVVVKPGIQADLDFDGSVSGADLLRLLRDWHSTPALLGPNADLNDDHVVDEEDLILFSTEWD